MDRKYTLGLLCAVWVHAVTAQDAAGYDPATADSELMPRAAEAVVTDIVASGNGAVAVGERGHVFLIDAAGQPTQVQVPTRSMLTNVYALDTLVWAVGHEEVILHSADAGHHWVRQHVNTEAIGPLLDLLMLDAKRGFAVGAEGTMLETTDGGTTWSRLLITDRQIGGAAPADEEAMDDADEESLVASDDIGFDETPPHLNAIVRTGAGLLIVGEGGAGYRSRDEGQSWERFELPYTGSMFGALVLDDGAVLVYGLRGKVFESRDFGSTWEELNSGTDAGLMGGVAVQGGRAVLVGGSGTLLTKDAGNPNFKAFQVENGGLLGGVMHRAGLKPPFIVVGENGITSFSPTPDTP